MINTSLNYTYKNLRVAWYLLIPLLLFILTLFYQDWFQTNDKLVLFEVYGHYFEKLEQGYFYFPYHVYITFFILITLTCLILFINPFNTLYKNSRIFGNARYANVKDIQKVGLLNKFGREKKEGTFICDAKIGKFKKKRLLLDQPLSVLLLAPPGTGKTAGVAIPTLLMAKNTIIALDVKGELFKFTSKYRNTFSDVMVFNPTSDDTSCWNPLDKTALPESYAGKFVHVQNVGACIFQEQKGSSDKHWVTAARSMFTNIALALIHKNGGTSIPEVRRATLSRSEIPRNELIADLSKVEGLPEATAGELEKYRSMGDSQFSGEAGTFDTGLIAFTDPRVEAAVSKNEIRFDELRGEKKEGGRSKTLYLIIKPEDITRLAPLVRIFFETLTMHLLSREWDKKNEHIITFLLDEFPRLGKLNEVAKMPALSRGQGVNVYLIAQDASQIEAEYEKTGREEIMSTTAYKVVLTQNSKDTAEFISKTIGDKTITIRDSSKSKDKVWGGGTLSVKEQGVPLIRPQELESLPMWKCLVLPQFSLQTPIEGELIRYFEDKTLMKRVGMIEDADIYRPKDLSDGPVKNMDVGSFLEMYEKDEEEKKVRLEEEKELREIKEANEEDEEEEGDDEAEQIMEKNEIEDGEESKDVLEEVSGSNLGQGEDFDEEETEEEEDVDDEERPLEHSIEEFLNEVNKSVDDEYVDDIDSM